VAPAKPRKSDADRYFLFEQENALALREASVEQ